MASSLFLVIRVSDNPWHSYCLPSPDVLQPDSLFPIATRRLW